MHSKPSYFPPEDATKNLCRSYVSPAYQDLGPPLWSIPSPHTAANKLAPCITGDMLIPQRSALSLSVHGAPGSTLTDLPMASSIQQPAHCVAINIHLRVRHGLPHDAGPVQKRADHHSGAKQQHDQRKHPQHGLVIRLRGRFAPDAPRHAAQQPPQQMQPTQRRQRGRGAERQKKGKVSERVKFPPEHLGNHFKKSCQGLVNLFIQGKTVIGDGA